MYSPIGPITTGCQDSMGSRSMWWQQYSQYQDMLVREHPGGLVDSVKGTG